MNSAFFDEDGKGSSRNCRFIWILDIFVKDCIRSGEVSVDCWATSDMYADHRVSLSDYVKAE